MLGNKIFEHNLVPYKTSLYVFIASKKVPILPYTKLQALMKERKMRLKS